MRYDIYGRYVLEVLREGEAWAVWRVDGFGRRRLRDRRGAARAFHGALKERSRGVSLTARARRCISMRIWQASSPVSARQEIGSAFR